MVFVGFAFLCEKMNFSLYFMYYITVYSKFIIDLNVKCETIKLLEEGIRENVCDLRLGNESLDTTPKASFTKEKK